MERGLKNRNLIHYIYLITTTDFENPRPNYSNEKIFTDDSDIGYPL